MPIKLSNNNKLSRVLPCNSGKQISSAPDTLQGRSGRSSCSGAGTNSACINRNCEARLLKRIVWNCNFRALKPLLASDVMLLLAIFSVILNALPSFASSVSISVTNSTQSLTLLPTADTPAFGKSGAVVATLSTDSSSGYTFTVFGSNDEQNLNGTVDNNFIPSIVSAVSESIFSSNNDYDNKWGFLPNKLNGNANVNYQPGPEKTIPTMIDITNSANSVVNEYTFAIAAKVDYSQVPDSYSTTITLAAAGNATQYHVSYIDPLYNWPTDEIGSTEDATITLSSLTPRRNGYTFMGWCSVYVAANETCSGETYQPGATYALSDGAVTNLYAIWGFPYMQDVRNWGHLLSTEQTMVAIDLRDGKEYTVARLADGRIWMTQNLDYEITNTTLTDQDTDLNTVTSWEPASTAYTANNGAPAAGSTTTTLSPNAWSRTSTVPYSAEGGDVYYYTSSSNSDDIVYTSLSACVSAGHTEADCRHYHRGNYYNWTAAIASNDSTSISTNYATAPNSICPKGWRLPIGASYGSFSQSDTWFAYLLKQAGIISDYPSTFTSNISYATNGFKNIRLSPLYFVRAGFVDSGSLSSASLNGQYWSSSAKTSSIAYAFLFGSSNVEPASISYGRSSGMSVRCVAR